MRKFARRSTIAFVVACMAAVGVAGPASATSLGIFVVGGEPAEAGEFKDTIVSIQYLDEERGWIHGCGGTVLDARTILTAAHCLPDSGTKEPEDIRVVGGLDRISETPEAQIRKIAFTVSHPKYDTTWQTPGFDIGLARLANPLRDVRGVSLPTPGTDALILPGSRLTLAGWGDQVLNSSTATDQLRKVNVPVLDSQECAAMIETNFNPESDMCAGVSGKGVCHSDSGGPLMRVVGTGPTRQIYQVGVVSRGDVGCAPQGSPTIFTYTGAPGIIQDLRREADQAGAPTN